MLSVFYWTIGIFRYTFYLINKKCKQKLIIFINIQFIFDRNKSKLKKNLGPKGLHHKIGRFQTVKFLTDACAIEI